MKSESEATMKMTTFISSGGVEMALPRRMFPILPKPPLLLAVPCLCLGAVHNNLVAHILPPSMDHSLEALLSASRLRSGITTDSVPVCKQWGQITLAILLS
jgi:hypothetical protein